MLGGSKAGRLSLNVLGMPRPETQHASFSVLLVVKMQRSVDVERFNAKNAGKMQRSVTAAVKNAVEPNHVISTSVWTVVGSYVKSATMAPIRGRFGSVRHVGSLRAIPAACL
jgi:hypothetical protein